MLNTALFALLLFPLPVGQAGHAQSAANLFATPFSTMVYVFFADGSVRFRPDAESAASLAAAGAAALVSIRGRSSTTRATAKDEALALARAKAARSYLIARGVPPLKITLNYASAADFIADNTTAAGRQQNQRVEIDIIHVPTGPGE